MRSKRRAKKRRRFRLLRSLVLLAFSLLIGVNAYLWNARNLVGNQLPMPFGYGVAVVLSGSMEPVLSVDDLVLIRETQDIQIGDIIVFQSGSELIIHRVVAIDGTAVQTKGDANNTADSPITLSDVKGKLVGSIPLAGKIVRALKSPAVILVLCVAFFVLMELSYRDVRRKDDAEIEEIMEEIRRLRS
ncbi:MAG: signal peptidase I [Lachnospiraceae bacterium]|nr:signal peptidase I [Lachnospiraceae bacterium]